MRNFNILFYTLFFILLTNNVVYAKQTTALIINSSAKDNIFLSYRNVLLEYRKSLLAPQDTLKIVFDENSFTPVLITSISSQGKQPIFAVLPGDVVQINFDQASNTYEFAGDNMVELNFCKKIWHSTLSLGGPYFEMLSDKMPASLQSFIGEWQRVRQESEVLIEELNALDEIRPEIKTHLARELRLRAFRFLMLPAIYHKSKGPVQVFPQFYRDSVIAHAQLLSNYKTLPPASSEQILYTLRSYIRYKALDQGKLPTFAVQYELAKKEYTGLQREWACYSILENAQATGENMDLLIKDYRSWVMPGSLFLRNLTGEEIPVMLDKQLTDNDLLMTVDNKPVTLSEMLTKHRGKVIYLDFWASWCVPCIIEFPASEEIRKQYRDQDLVMIYLSIDKDAAKWQQASSRLLKNTTEQYRFKDAASSIFLKRFEVESIPRYMIIDQKGIIRFADAPRPSGPTLRAVLDNLLIR